MMDQQFIRERISILRTKKNISEYRMSTDLGHSKSYIQSISSGRALPSMSEFLYICEYLGVTPKEFFDDGIEYPRLVRELYELSRNLSEDNLKILIDLAKRLND
jgi:transcriptional regulator with XRE-family HTH domain